MHKKTVRLNNFIQEFDLTKSYLFLDLIFLETSAKSGENVEESFLKVSKTILSKIETGEINPDDVASGIQYSDQAIKNKIQNRQRESSKLGNCSGSSCRS